MTKQQKQTKKFDTWKDEEKLEEPKTRKGGARFIKEKKLTKK